MLALVGLHLIAVLIHQLLGHDLIGPMFSGRKRLAADVEGPTISPPWSGLIGAALALLAYIALVVLDGD